jgi:outer membrane biosynthesis protein TonB
MSDTQESSNFPIVTALTTLVTMLFFLFLGYYVNSEVKSLNVKSDKDDRTIRETKLGDLKAQQKELISTYGIEKQGEKVIGRIPVSNAIEILATKGQASGKLLLPSAPEVAPVVKAPEVKKEEPKKEAAPAPKVVEPTPAPKKIEEPKKEATPASAPKVEAPAKK